MKGATLRASLSKKMRLDDQIVWLSFVNSQKMKLLNMHMKKKGGKTGRTTEFSTWPDRNWPRHRQSTRSNIFRCQVSHLRIEHTNPSIFLFAFHANNNNNNRNKNSTMVLQTRWPIVNALDIVCDTGWTSNRACILRSRPDFFQFENGTAKYSQPNQSTNCVTAVYTRPAHD